MNKKTCSTHNNYELRRGKSYAHIEMHIKYIRNSLFKVLEVSKLVVIEAVFISLLKNFSSNSFYLSFY